MQDVKAVWYVTNRHIKKSEKSEQLLKPSFKTAFFFKQLSSQNDNNDIPKFLIRSVYPYKTKSFFSVFI